MNTRNNLTDPIELPKIQTQAIIQFDDMRQLLLEEGQRVSIDQINWSEFPYKPVVDVHVAHDEAYLWALYRVDENHVRAVTLEDMGPVYEDSCVEWFMQFPNQENYFNVEVNCIGACLASCRVSRTDKAAFANEELASIIRLTTLNHQPCDLLSDDTPIHWECVVGIPKKVLMNYLDGDGGIFPNQFTANFYKCGDKTNTPHYVSSFPIVTDSPDFHVPSAFHSMMLREI